MSTQCDILFPSAPEIISNISVSVRNCCFSCHLVCPTKSKEIQLRSKKDQTAS